MLRLSELKNEVICLTEAKVILSLCGIVKLFPGVKALSDVSIDFREGEIHALCGENGAGKSTFIKIITGALRPDAGSIVIDGETYDAVTPALARSKGIEAIYQEFNLIDSLSAAENICLGKKYGRFVNQNRMNQVAEELFNRFHIDINPSTMVRDLSSGKRQIVEIAKAVSKNARILIMDEPTAPLSVGEVETLMDIIATLKQAGVTILYISHRLDEVFRIADRVSVLRDGQHIVTRDIASTTKQELIRYMVGRELTGEFPKRKSPAGSVALELDGLTGNGVKNVSFQARHGEIVGLAGLVGAGRSEIMKVVVGYEKRQRGRVLVDGKEVSISSPGDALRCGIGLVPEDRKREGLMLPFSIRWNTAISSLKKISKVSFISTEMERTLVEEYRSRLRIKSTSAEQPVMTLSGGNQQKVVVAKTLAAEPRIIIFDEPTRGIDVGAKQEIYELMNELCDEGYCIVMISSDMEELIGMSDRIVVFSDKCVAGELNDRALFSQETILAMASVNVKEASKA